MMTKRWRVDVFIGERDGGTHAEARLVPADRATMTGVGDARLNPRDHDVPEIGDEIAVGRALGDLANKLLVTASGDIEAVRASADVREEVGWRM